jgi:hypothetical protein
MPKRIELNPVKSGRPERLALNLWDLERVHPQVRARILPLLDIRRESAVWIDPDREDETACPFTCALVTAAAAADLIRGMARQCGEPPPRVYLNRLGVGSWVRLAGEAILTHLLDGRVVLSPAVFPGEVVEFRPLPARRVVT